MTKQRKNSYVYSVYDIKDSERLVGIFNTTSELARFFNTTANAIRSSISRNHAREKQYLIEKVELE